MQQTEPVKIVKFEVRCWHCNHKLGEFKSVSGEIKCPKCKKLNHIKR